MHGAVHTCDYLPHARMLRLLGDGKATQPDFVWMATGMWDLEHGLDLAGTNAIYGSLAKRQVTMVQSIFEVEGKRSGDGKVSTHEMNDVKNFYRIGLKSRSQEGWPRS